MEKEKGISLEGKFMTKELINFALGEKNMYQLISGHKLVQQHLHKLPNARMIEKCSLVIYKQMCLKKK